MHTEREITFFPIARDSSYVITGSKRAGFVLFCELERVAESRFAASLIMRAVGHYAARNGATIINAVTGA